MGHPLGFLPWTLEGARGVLSLLSQFFHPLSIYLEATWAPHQEPSEGRGRWDRERGQMRGRGKRRAGRGEEDGGGERRSWPRRENSQPVHLSLSPRPGSTDHPLLTPWPCSLFLHGGSCLCSSWPASFSQGQLRPTEMVQALVSAAPQI